MKIDTCFKGVTNQKMSSVFGPLWCAANCVEEYIK